MKNQRSQLYYFRISTILIKVKTVSGLFEPFYTFSVILPDVSEEI